MAISHVCGGVTRSGSTCRNITTGSWCGKCKEPKGFVTPTVPPLSVQVESATCPRVFSTSDGDEWECGNESEVGVWCTGCATYPDNQDALTRLVAEGRREALRYSGAASTRELPPVTGEQLRAFKQVSADTPTQLAARLRKVFKEGLLASRNTRVKFHKYDSSVHVSYSHALTLLTVIDPETLARHKVVLDGSTYDIYADYHQSWEKHITGVAEQDLPAKPSEANSGLIWHYYYRHHYTPAQQQFVQTHADSWPGDTASLLAAAQEATS